MDIYDYLKLDHKKVAHLFKQFEKSESLERKKEVMEMIVQELIVHAESEQSTFYKALEGHSESRAEISHAEKEHKEIEVQIAAILNAKTNTETWEAHVSALKKMVEHHVDDEEGNIFKKAREILSDDEAHVIKEKMHDLKGELLLNYKAQAKPKPG